jgi:hypothetical protein
MAQTLQREHDLHANVTLDKLKRQNMLQYQRIIKVREG